MLEVGQKELLSENLLIQMGPLPGKFKYRNQ